MRTAFVVAAMAGCGFSPAASSDGHLAPDAPRAADAPLVGDGSGSSDGGLTRTTSCMDRWHAHDAAFDPPVLLAELGSGANPQSDPFVSADELTIYYVATGPTGGSAEIYTAARPDLDHPFAQVQPFAAADTDGNQSKLSLTGDNSVFVVASDRKGNGNLDLFLSTAKTPGAYSSPDDGELAAVDDGNNQYDPSITLDGLAIYYAPDSAGLQQINVTSRGALGSDFGDPVPVRGLGASEDFADEDPAVSADQSVIVFSSHRNASVDIFYATRALPVTSPESGFGSAFEPGGINNPTAGDGDPMLGSDGCRLYFESNRSGSNEIYQATMTLP